MSELSARQYENTLNNQNINPTSLFFEQNRSNPKIETKDETIENNTRD